MTDSDRERQTAGGAPVLGRTTPGSEPAPVVTTTPDRADGKRSARGGGSRLRPAALAALIAGLTVGILVAVFAAQNSQGVEVHFLSYSSRSAPQFVVIVVSVLVGVLIGLLLGLSGRRRRP